MSRTYSVQVNRTATERLAVIGEDREDRDKAEVYVVRSLAGVMVRAAMPGHVTARWLPFDRSARYFRWLRRRGFRRL